MSSNTTRYTCQVHVNNIPQPLFVFYVHFSTSEKGRLIDPAFYLQHGQVEPTDDHHELEIMEPRNLRERKRTAPIHIHFVPAIHRRFVCFTGLLSTLADVEQVLAMWCVGTTFTLLTDTDFGPVYGADPETFMQRMQEQHGITFHLTRVA